MADPPASTVQDDSPPSTDDTDRARDRRERTLNQYVPMVLLGVLFALLALFVATHADDYGRTWDEIHQNWYGQVVFQWYQSGGVDRTFLTAQPALYMHQHGPFAETIIATAQHLTGEQWHTRSVVGGILGIVGIAGIALCGFQLGKWWGALLAAVGLTLYPRYTGAIFNNSKDVPFTAAMIFVLWASIRLARRWDQRRHFLADSAVLGLTIGIAMSVRATALIWYAVLGLLALVWCLWNRSRIQEAHAWRETLGKLGQSALLIGVTSYLTMLVLWPYITTQPVNGLIDSIKVMSKFGWYGQALFEGQLYYGHELPWHYAPEWLIIGSPLPTVVLALVGLGFVIADLVRREPAVAELLTSALLIIPILAIVLMHATLYNGLRHFLFVAPALVLLGVVGLLRMWNLLLRRRRRVVAYILALVMIVEYSEVVLSASRLYPLEYMYLSPLVGGYAQAESRYETDYWRACQSLGLRWLEANHRTYSASTSPVVGGILDVLALAELPPGFRRDDNSPDFYIGMGYTKPVDYSTIHEVTREGVVVCTVSARPVAD